MEHDEGSQKARDEMLAKKVAHQAQRQDLLKGIIEHHLKTIQVYLKVYQFHMKVPRTIEGFVAREDFLEEFATDVKDCGKEFSINLSYFLRSDRYGREPPRVPGPSADANCEGGH
jgi:hypothetical protein